MPTDHACRTAAEQAAHCLTPVRSALVPADPVEPAPAEVMPVVLRNYLGASARPSAPRASGARRPAPVGVATGAVVLRMCLDGLHAEMTGTMTAWHTDLGPRLRETLADPRSTGRPQADAWQPLTDLQLRAHEVLATVADHGRTGSAGPRLLIARFALLEDAVSGALRRTAVPAETAARCAAGLAAAAGSLFGLALPQTAGAESGPY
ncbi:hypothetical protein ACWC10_04760 [Streptomyces sp. NPDC001595]|uniref:hypothetical protein n=1 Tax=Streptomyces sp. NPDC001532 TaxID=3154520 RepID=UPI00332941F7